jgi:hypothetical protein
MPLRFYRASTAAYRIWSGHAGTHVAGNLAAWMAGSLAVAVAAFFLSWLEEGGTSVWDHVGACAVMLLGILVMAKAQEGYVPPDDLDGG